MVVNFLPVRKHRFDISRVTFRGHGYEVPDKALERIAHGLTTGGETDKVACIAVWLDSSTIAKQCRHYSLNACDLTGRRSVAGPWHFAAGTFVQTEQEPKIAAISTNKPLHFGYQQGI